MRKVAEEIVEEHFRRVNPSMWDGSGKQPADFNNHRITYSINRYTELDVTFERGAAGGWKHCCKLRDTLADNLLSVQYGLGIDSPQELTKTILEICKTIEGVHMSYSQVKNTFQELKRCSPNEDLTAHIIFTEDSFPPQYPLLSRTYSFSSDNKAFCLGMDSWTVEDCYILEKMRDAAAIPHFVRKEQEDGTVCYFFGDTCIRVRESYEAGKIHMDPLTGDQTACGEWVELTIDRVYGYCTLLERYLNRQVSI